MPKKHVMPQRIKVHDQVDTISCMEFEVTLKNLKSYVDTLIAMHGADAQIEYSSTGYTQYSDSPGYALFADRDETDEEYKIRTKEDADRIAAIDAKDRKEFERLKKKFGDK